MASAPAPVYPRLRRQLTILFLLLSLLPLAIVAWLTYESYQNSIKHEVTRNLSEIVRNKSLLVEQWLTERSNDAAVISHSDFFVEDLVGITRAPVAAPTAARLRARAFLSLVKQTYGYYDDLFALDTLGRLLVTTGEAPLAGIDYVRAVSAGRVYVSDITWSEALGRPTMIIAAPVDDPAGRRLGVFVLRVRTDMLNRIMQEIGVGRTGESYLVNRDGDFLTELKFRPGAVLRQRLPSDLRQHWAARPTGIGQYLDYRRVAVLGAWRCIPDRQWCLVAEIDRREAFIEITRLRMRIMTIGLAFAVLIIIATFQTVRLITRRLERTQAALARKQEELIQSGKLVAIGEMAAGIAHEINNPLTTIKVLIHSVSSELAPESPLKKDYAIVLNEIDKINRLILRFLQFARPQEPEFYPVDVNETLTRILLLLEHQTEAQGIQVTARYDPALAPILADGHQIGQAFLNIILNAIQAMTTGGMLTVTTRAESGRGVRRVRVEIADTGPGIPPEVQARIFEPFFTTKTQGTGLGLSITRGIIEKHGGTVELATAPGRGTSFTIILPDHRP